MPRVEIYAYTLSKLVLDWNSILWTKEVDASRRQLFTVNKTSLSFAGSGNERRYEDNEKFCKREAM